MRRLLTVLVLLVLFSCTPGIDNPQPAASTPTSAPASITPDGCSIPTGIAHRGGAGAAYTENTLKAYQHVWAWGVNAWETDIRWDAAGQTVLMHDASIDRTTTGAGAVTATTWSTSTVRMNDGQALRDQTLRQLLELAAARGAMVAIEPKVAPTAAQASAVVGLIDATVGRDRVILDSFEPANLAPFRKVAPDITYSLVTSTVVTPAAAAEVGSILNIKASVLTKQLVDDYHAAGVAVYAWTLDGPGQWAPYRALGVDRYVTNQAKDYRAWRDWVCSGEVWL